MKSFQKPLWWIFILIAPLAVLLLSEFSTYAILNTELKEPESFEAWGKVLGLQSFIVVFSSAYLIVAFKKGKTVHWVFPVMVILSEIGFLFLLMTYDRELIPWSVPNWMVNDEEFMLSHLALCMPSIFFAILQLVSYSIKEDKEYQIWKSALFVILIPASWYCFYLIVLPLFRHSDNYDMIRRIEHVALVIGIITTVIFFYFLIRTLILLSIKSMNVEWLRVSLLVLTTLILPIFGLLVNDYSEVIKYVPGFDTHVFGDFSHWAFYALTISNGILLLIPPLKNAKAQKITVALRFALLPFTLYFLLVFIPFLPLSVLAVIFFGLGLLVLSPVLMFVFNIHRILTDLGNKEIFPEPITKLIVILPVLFLPAVVTLDFWLDKKDLKEAMAYVYEPDYTQNEISIDKDRLHQVLAIVTANGSDRTNLFRGRDYWKPYLSTYYRWLVLDNLTLSGKKISEMEQIFLGTYRYYSARNQGLPENDLTRVAKLNFEMKNEKTFNSFWVHMEIENTSESQQQYQGAIKLPEGAFIRNYYLDVNGVRNYGILAERKTAQWVYNNIVSYRRDPGLLTYSSKGNYDLKVFPLESKQIRKTGFEIIYPGKLEIKVAGSRGVCAIPVEDSVAKVSSSESVIFISEQEKNSLPLVTRKPYMYFLLNNSEELKKSDKEKLATALEKVLLQNTFDKDSYEFLLVNHSIKRINEDNWKKVWLSDSGDGGYFADRAIRSLAVQNYRNASRNAPVFVMVSNTAGVYPAVERDLYFTCPDYDHTYMVYEGGIQKQYLFEETINIDDTSAAKQNEIFRIDSPVAVRCWPDNKAPKYYLSENGPSLIYKNENFETEIEGRNGWEQAAIQSANARYLALHPNEIDRKWRLLLKQNFSTGILSPHTAYMVVETEAQKEVLLKKQQEVMNASPSLDLDQGFVSMSEPQWWWYAIGIFVFLMVRWNKTKNRPKYS